MQLAKRRHLAFGAALGIALIPSPALAHSFGEVFTLPMPFWLYGWGSAAALILSFLLIALSTGKSLAATTASRDLSQHRSVRLMRKLHLKALAQSLSVGALLLCIVSGLWGVRSPYGNFNMTFFWIVFLLGASYGSALFGNIYSVINPWYCISAAINRFCKAFDRARIKWPTWLGYWPALLLYGALIWLELLGASTPYALSVALLSYSLLNLAAVAIFGSNNWFRYGEIFSVLFTLLSRLSPLDYVAKERGQAANRTDCSRLQLRWPLAHLTDLRVSHWSLQVFIFFMLSSTAFDGLHETTLWKQWFWLDLYQNLLRDFSSNNPLAAFPQMRQWFIYWQGFWLFASVTLYLLAYLLSLQLGKWLANSPRSITELALGFAPSLLPIALAYHVAHYYTLIQTQGIKIISLISDPLGRGDNIFGTANWLQRQFIPDANTVWHIQLGSILLGHVLGALVAHRLAQRLFESERKVILSQLPMLALMVGLTTSGLWILSLPH
jgi:hypothetical protein